MVENGVYIIKQEYFDKFKQLGCTFKDNKSGTRPTFCCVKDEIIPDLFWAIPTSKITSNKNMDRFLKYTDLPKYKLGYSFYHIGVTNVPCIFCISSCFPITNKYIEREYIVNNRHLILKSTKQTEDVKNKLMNILKAEQLSPNKFEQKITTIRNYLKEELLQS
jgi:hypothetical protein